MDRVTANDPTRPVGSPKCWRQSRRSRPGPQILDAPACAAAVQRFRRRECCGTARDADQRLHDRRLRPAARSPLSNLAGQFINKVRGINRVADDVGCKPQAAIELGVESLQLESRHDESGQRREPVGVGGRRADARRVLTGPTQGTVTPTKGKDDERTTSTAHACLRDRTGRLPPSSDCCRQGVYGQCPRVFRRPKYGRKDD